MKTIKGDCKICKTNYNVQVYEHVHDDPYSSGFYYKPCPRCGYNPEIKEKILEILMKEVSATITPRKIHFNSQELSNLVNNIIAEYWPKGGSK